MRSKREIKKIEEKIKRLGDPEKFDIRVSWRDPECKSKDDPYEWQCEDGSIEYITREEYLKRGGKIIEINWDDDEVNE